jgi:hypothetical protein
MARIRTVKPEFWTDEKVVELSAFARLLFIGLWNFCDDDGRMVLSPKRIKMQIFPADSLDISELFGELRRESLITIYKVENTEYLQVNSFVKHQKIDKRTASKLPPPPINGHPDSIPTESPRALGGNCLGREGKGREGIKEGKEYSPEPEGSPPANSSEQDFFIELPLNNGDNYGVLSAHVQEFKKLYPRVDVEQALRSMRAWCIANPDKRKTRRGVLRFINTWLSKDQDRGGNRHETHQRPDNSARGRVFNATHEKVRGH